MSILAAFIASHSGNTAKAYRRDLEGFTAFLGRDPLSATRADVDSFVRSLEGNAAPSTIARKLAAINGFYGYAVAEGELERNPVTNVRRPRVSTESQTLGLSLPEAQALLRAARKDGPRAAALVHLLLVTAGRIGEVLALDVDDLQVEYGYRVVRLHGKGGKVRVLPLSSAADALDAYLQGRTSGAVFTTRTGTRWAASEAYRAVQRLAAEAGIAQAERITPHSLRHTSITAAFESGAASRDVADFAGHADIRTSERYDRARRNLHRSPAHTLGAVFADSPAA